MLNYIKRFFKAFEENWLVNLIITIVTLTFFIGVDWIFHKYPLFNVQNVYFVNKLIYFPIIYFVLLSFFDIIKLKNYMLIFIISAVTVIVLQIRYFFIYDVIFNVIVMIVHYVLIEIPTYIMFKNYKDY